MGEMHNDTGEIRKLTIRSSPTVVAPLIALLLLLFPPQLFGQVLRDPATPYHFLRYDDVPVDQQNPAWTHDFWAPIKFIPLTIAPGSYLNFGGELRERVEHFSHPFFSLTLSVVESWFDSNIALRNSSTICVEDFLCLLRNVTSIRT